MAANLNGNVEDYVIFSSIGFGVPIFLMLLGTSFLSYSNDIKLFLKNDFLKILIPFVIWNVILVFLNIVFNNQLVVTNYKLINDFINYFLIQYWYAWMLIGTFLTIPIFSEFIKSKKMEGIKYFLVLAILSSVIYQLISYFAIDNFLNLGFFVGPIIYCFLGFYLDNYKFKQSSNRLFFAGLILFALTSIFIVFFVMFTGSADKIFFLQYYDFLTLTNLDISVVSIIQAVGMFLIFKYLNKGDVSGIVLSIKKLFKVPFLDKLFNKFSNAAYGIFLVHQIIILLLSNFLIKIDNTLELFVLAVFIFFLSGAFIYLLSKVISPSYYIGYFDN